MADQYATLRYAFVDGDSVETTWTDDEKAAFRAATASWAAVADLAFMEVANPAEADWIEHVTDTRGFELLGESENTLGTHDTPEHAAENADGQAHGWFNREGYGWRDGGMGWAPEGLVPGGYGFEPFVHEIGHALGLAHPHDTGGGSPRMPGVTSAFGAFGTGYASQTAFSAMSCNRGLMEIGFHVIFGIGPDPVENGRVTEGYAIGPSAIDIAAIQFLYGARRDAHAGDDLLFGEARGR